MRKKELILENLGLGFLQLKFFKMFSLILTFLRKYFILEKYCVQSVYIYTYSCIYNLSQVVYWVFIFLMSNVKPYFI